MKNWEKTKKKTEKRIVLYLSLVSEDFEPNFGHTPLWVKLRFRVRLSSKTNLKLFIVCYHVEIKNLPVNSKLNEQNKRAKVGDPHTFGEIFELLTIPDPQWTLLLCPEKVVDQKLLVSFSKLWYKIFISRWREPRQHLHHKAIEKTTSQRMTKCGGRDAKRLGIGYYDVINCQFRKISVYDK